MPYSVKNVPPKHMGVKRENTRLTPNKQFQENNYRNGAPARISFFKSFR